MIMHLELAEARKRQLDAVYALIEKNRGIAPKLYRHFVLPKQGAISSILPVLMSEVITAYLVTHSHIENDWEPDGPPTGTNRGDKRIGRVVISYSRGSATPGTLFRSFFVKVRSIHPHCPFHFNPGATFPAMPPGSGLSPAMELRERVLDLLYTSIRRLDYACRFPDNTYPRNILLLADYHMNPQLWVPEPQPGGKIGHRYDSEIFPASWMRTGADGFSLYSGKRTYRYPDLRDEPDVQRAGLMALQFAITDEFRNLSNNGH